MKAQVFGYSEHLLVTSRYPRDLLTSEEDLSVSGRHAELEYRGRSNPESGLRRISSLYL